MGHTSIKLGATAGATDQLHLIFGYGEAANNGNVLSQAISRQSFSVTQTYGYADPLNRLSSVTEGAESRTFDYSPTGNMWVTTASTNFAAGSFTPRTSTWYNASNRLVNTGLGIAYDLAGNQTAIGGYANTFDAENRLTSSTINSVTTSYAYDGEGRRVKKGSMVMVYDASGKLAAEYGGAVASAGREYLTGDHLGSTRLVTNATGGDAKCSDYLPFGEEIPQGINSRGTCYAAFTDPRQKFTGKERDNETGLDYFIARYFSGAQGRFASPDKPFADQHAEDPQSWNLYSYARNNPLKYIDRTGQAIETPWDVFNIAMGTASAAGNLVSGNYVGAAIDVVGIAYDSFATAVPILPGGAGTAINVARYVRISERVFGSAKNLERLAGTFENSQKVARISRSIANNIKNHLKPSDLAGAVKDILGKPVTIAGKDYQHLTEVQNALVGLKNSASDLAELLKSSKLTDVQRSATQAALSQTSAQISRVEKILDTAEKIGKELNR